MNFETFKRVIKLGFVNFYRNGWLSFVTSLVLSLTLVIISIFLITNIVINVTAKNLESKIDISVYFYDSTTEEQIGIIKRQISTRSDVVDVKYISKEDALEIWQSRPLDDKIKNLVTEENNPLPRSLEVRASDTSYLENIAYFLQREEYSELVRKVDYQENKDIIVKLNNAIDFTRKIGIIFSLVFVVISVLVILNTIKLNIITRKDEIEIMRLVGANNIFIRIPFFVEGVLYGIAASIISLLIVVIGFNFLTPLVNNYLGDLSLNFSQFFNEHILMIFLLQLIIGIMVSILCSFISMQRYLKK
jgi:cell division transport system permease protein